MEIIAHRGASWNAPENTLLAAQRAWQEGADAVEGDFRLTRDGHIVAIHDATLKRTAGVDRAVSELPLDELRRLDERIATLEELLAIVPHGKRFYVEIKCGAEIIPELSRVISVCGLAAEQIVLICLDLAVIVAIKRAIPHCPAYWVVEFKRDSTGRWQPATDEMLRAAKEAGLDGLDLMATGPIDADLVRRAKSAGLRLCTWTVDDPAQARRLIDLGVQGITTNKPGWLRGQLRR